ncbi:FxDxF family double-cut PEP-CTERM protein [Mitsuaria sp. CC2]|uniref:FxDxF family double-cut PEP-CTERM protein n=1 Tax=Mitsuaria sp. CC2 TaxID=3029186 RepID=UPI003B8AE96A
MTLKTRFLAAALVAAAVSAAHAAPVTAAQSVALKSGTTVDTKTAGFTINHLVAGEFVDTFTFTGMDRWGLVNASLTTSAQQARFNIDFISATVNGQTVNFSRTALGSFQGGFEFGRMDDDLLSGPLVLTVRGYAGQGLAPGSAISASYSGTINVTQVPEPGSMALAALGLFGMGVVVRRRRATRSVLAAAALAAAATGAMAASDLNQTHDTVLAGDQDGLTGAPFVTHTEAGSFLDTLTFHYAGTGLVDASLITIGAGAGQQISFTEVLLNGRALTIDPATPMGNATYQRAWLDSTMLAGDYTLIVKGIAGGSLAAGTSGIAATYSTTFNVLPASAVPEPQSYAMFLGGLALMTLMLRKRRQSV